LIEHRLHLPAEGLVRGNTVGWASPQILSALRVGLVLVVAFVAWELRTDAPMLPMCFRGACGLDPLRQRWTGRV